MIRIKNKICGGEIWSCDRDSLVGADLRGVKLVNADFADLDLSGANLSEARLTGSCFRRTILSGANLTAAKMAGADLTDARLETADLLNVDLEGANLTRAQLLRAGLDGANLRNAILCGADLAHARLTHASLVDADLAGAYLSGSILLEVDLTRTNLGSATLAGTYIEASSLSAAKGLANVTHFGPSVVGHWTLRACITELPDVFLRGVGYSNEEIDTFRALYSRPIRFYSCFISYARLNGEFAERLHNDLEAKNVPCWIDIHDMRGGDYFRSQIDEAIRLYDRVILVCSGEGLLRDAVVEEIITGLEVQEKTRIKKLFPIRIDEHIFSEEVAAESRRRHHTGEWRMDWVSRIRAFHIPDFRGWEDHKTYQQALDRLLRDLCNSG